MMRVPAVVASLMFFVPVCCIASSAAADPVLVLSGIVETAFGGLGEPWDAESLQLHGAGLSIDSSLEDEVASVQLSNLPTIAPGALVDFSGLLRVEDQIGALLDNSFGIIAAPFTMSFAAAPTRLTCGTSVSLTQCVGSAPFTFEADVTFTPFGGVPVIRQLVGGGRVEGVLDSGGFRESGAVRYVFEPSPVPEPATIMLLVSGIVAAAGVARQRRRR
jgi:hypothetical protein